MSQQEKILPIRIIIVDDHTVVREGLASLLGDEQDLKVLAQGGDGQAAVDLCRVHDPDVLLLDITMPGLNGLEAAKIIKAEKPGIGILFLTMHEEKGFFFEALRVGASGYVLKGVPSENLVSAIRDVFQGGVYLTPELAGSLVEEFVQRTPQPQVEDLLTQREQEIVQLIARGLTNSDIARHLTLSINTVKSHRLHIYQKLDLNNRTELINYAVRHGLFHGFSKPD